MTDWEKNHKLENWNFAEAHGHKIKELVSHEFYGTNCLCFVKLFQEQFILMCKHDKLLIDKKDDEINGPDHIKAAYDPLKLKRLNVRMSTPDPNYGPNPAPKFTGYQEFFKDFIDISANPTFQQLLKDSLNLEIQKVSFFLASFINTVKWSNYRSTMKSQMLKMEMKIQLTKYSHHILTFK